MLDSWLTILSFFNLNISVHCHLIFKVSGRNLLIILSVIPLECNSKSVAFQDYLFGLIIMCFSRGLWIYPAKNFLNPLDVYIHTFHLVSWWQFLSFWFSFSSWDFPQHTCCGLLGGVPKVLPIPIHFFFNLFFPSLPHFLISIVHPIKFYIFLAVQICL